jgi:phospholipase/carboxylesterase
MDMEMTLPARSGPRPHTTPTNPHTQLDQQPTDPAIPQELAARAFALPDIEERPSAISVPGARALWLREDAPVGPREAFLIGREFAHLHPAPDFSLHLTLPLPWTEHVMAQGWGELHPVAMMGLIPATTVMVYAPRNAEELEVATRILQVSHHFAGGRGDHSDQE